MYKKFALILILIFFIWIWKDYKKIDTGFVNQSSITYSYDNLDNNFIKKVHGFINSTYENYLYNNSDEHKDYWKVEDKSKRDNLPNFKILKSDKNFTKSITELKNTGTNWYRSHGNNSSNRFSSLKKINKNNAKDLDVAWTFEHEGFLNDIQANPIVVNGIIYTPITGGYIAAIDGTNGNLIWKSKQYGNFVAKRGLLYYQSNINDEPSKLFFSNRERLICINALDGKPIEKFGKEGRIKTGLNVLTPVIYKNNIIIVTWDHAVEVYDLTNGNKKWKLKYKKDINTRVGGKKFINDGYNPWGGISLDDKRGILYFTTGNPHYYFDGTQRPGNNPGSNSIIAVDLNKKKVIWSFQETSHDIWNSDIPSPPILSSISFNNKKIDIVLAPTKRANTLMLDRVSGKPIFDFRYRKVPTSKIKGEKTSTYQPFLELPEPFGRNEFFYDDLWSYDLEKLESIKNQYKDHNFGFYNTYELNKKNLQYNFNGGAEWMGASVNHKSGIMYVTSNNIPWETSVDQIDDKTTEIPSYSSNFQRALDDKGFPITRPPWGTISAINLNTGKIIWQVPFGEYEELSKMGHEITGTENFGGVTGSEGGVLFATGTLDKKFYVFDSNNGNILYSKIMPFIGSAPPTTYSINGKQYIIVHSTGGKSLETGYPDLVQTGNKIISFSLN